MAKKSRKSKQPTPKKKPQTKAGTKATSKTKTKPASKTQKRVLHIEGGKPESYKLHRLFRNNDDWHVVRIDPDKKLKPDYAGDLRNLKSVPDASMEAIWCGQNFHRLMLHEVPDVLKECTRIIKQDGMVVLGLFGATKIGETLKDKKLETNVLRSQQHGELAAIDMLYGPRKELKKHGESAAYHSAFSGYTIANKLRAAGLRNIQVREDGYYIWAAAHKLAKGHPSFDTEPSVVNYNTARSKTKDTLPDRIDQEPQQWQSLGLKK